MNARRAGLILAFGLFPLGCGRAPGAPTVEKVAAAETATAEGTMSADSLRTGFYPNQPALDPAVVGSPYFGQIFDAALDGQIYAQPLYVNGVVLVATETNNVYALDAATGSPLWTRTLGTPFQAADLNCGDLTPTIGVTGTPAIDSASGTAYLLSKSYANGFNGAAIWYVHALDLETGDERTGFPVVIAGSASNAPSKAFDAERQMQRPGLLLMNDVVYVGFGAHCDEAPYAGWVVGISTKGYVQTLWTAEAGASLNGAGIWQSGGGPVSDGDGQILFATGNDWTSLPAPVAGHEPPATLGEAIVRLSLQPDGTLAATDFFSPGNRDTLNYADADVGSGAPIGLPETFGTSSHPNLLVESGKEGYVMLLDRDDLGGYKQGLGGDDRLLQKIGPGGGVVVAAQRLAGRRRLGLRPRRGQLHGRHRGRVLARPQGGRLRGRRAHALAGRDLVELVRLRLERGRRHRRRDALGLRAAVDRVVVRLGGHGRRAARVRRRPAGRQLLAALSGGHRHVGEVHSARCR